MGKLQLYVQQVNAALEETSRSVLSGMPRVLRDAHALQNEAEALREKMAAVKQEIAKVQKNKQIVFKSKKKKNWLMDSVTQQVT